VSAQKKSAPAPKAPNPQEDAASRLAKAVSALEALSCAKPLAEVYASLGWAYQCGDYVGADRYVRQAMKEIQREIFECAIARARELAEGDRQAAIADLKATL
jgi:hypothetical protein